MKNRIGDLIYDSKTAKKIGEYSSDLPVNDFGYYQEALYKTQADQYFLVGHGGPEQRDTEIINGKKHLRGNAQIKPLTFAQAKEWYQDFILNDSDQDKKEAKRIYKNEFESE